MSDANLGFWSDGAEIHSKALEQERNERIAELKHQQELATSSAERAELAIQIEQVRKTHQQKIDEEPWLLF
ncbi:MAG: hypothetical protein H8E66_20935 [Planctomycetes bacterium]|nr:hypothetical protein [Planctomycetota bacterium]